MDTIYGAKLPVNTLQVALFGILLYLITALQHLHLPRIFENHPV